MIISLSITYGIFNNSNNHQAIDSANSALNGFREYIEIDQEGGTFQSSNAFINLIDQYTTAVVDVYNKYKDSDIFNEYSEDSEEEYLDEVELVISNMVNDNSLKIEDLFQSISACVYTNSIDSMYLAYLDMNMGRIIYLLDVSKNATSHPFGYVDDISILRLHKSDELPYKFEPRVENDLCWGGETIYKPGSTNRCCFILVDIPMANYKKEAREFVLYEALSMVLITISLTLTYMFLSNKFIVKNIRKLDNSVKEFSNSLNQSETLKKIDIDINSSDEVGSLSKNTINLSDKLIQYMNDLKIKAYEEEKNKADLNLARKIQLEALPLEYFENDYCKIRASYTPAKDVGGDFYQYFTLKNNRVCFLISDVSGKGVSAALFMMRSKEILTSLIESGKSLSESFSIANNKLLTNNAEGLFITSFAAIFDLSKEELEYVNAGHEAPILIKNGKSEIINLDSNFVLAGLDNYKYKSDKIKLEKGDSIFIYTDGISEAIDINMKEFGINNIMKSLDNSDNESDLMIHNLKNDLAHFVNNETQFDDETCLLFTYKPNSFTRYIDNPKIEDLSKLFDDLKLEFKSSNEDDISKICVILDELLSNIINYNLYDKFIYLKIEKNEKCYCIDIYDNTNKFDPFNHTKDENQSEGGFGIEIVKNLSSEYSYEFKNDLNHIRILLDYEKC